MWTPSAQMSWPGTHCAQDGCGIVARCKKILDNDCIEAIPEWQTRLRSHRSCAAEAPDARESDVYVDWQGNEKSWNTRDMEKVECPSPASTGGVGAPELALQEQHEAAEWCAAAKSNLYSKGCHWQATG